jgi:hypothetical protein
VNVLACAQSCSPAADCGALDTDGDGLNDVWETNGYVDVNCNGQYDEGTDTPLPNADKNKPNIYLKLDYMVKTAVNPAQSHTHKPTDSQLNLVKDALASHDIVLSIYPTQDALTEIKVITPTPEADIDSSCAGTEAVSYYTVKAAHFPAKLAPAYYYAVFAHDHTCGSDAQCSHCATNAHTLEIPTWGYYTSTGIAAFPGRDMIVAFGSLVDKGLSITEYMPPGELLHVLGHGMGLRHGGGDDLDNKPNYLSAMNSTYKFGIFRTFPYDPDYPWSVMYQNPVAGFYNDYSTFAAITLHEGSSADGGVCGSDDSGGLDETVGIPAPEGYFDVTCQFIDPYGGTVWGPGNGHAIDWDTSGEADNQHVYQDVSGDGLCTDLPGFNDLEHASAAEDVTKFAHLQMNVACGTRYWTTGVQAP